MYCFTVWKQKLKYERRSPETMLRIFFCLLKKMPFPTHRKNLNMPLFCNHIGQKMSSQLYTLVYQNFVQTPHSVFAIWKIYKCLLHFNFRIFFFLLICSTMNTLLIFSQVNVTLMNVGVITSSSPLHTKKKIKIKILSTALVLLTVLWFGF